MLYIVLVQWPFVPTGKLVQKGTDGGIPCRLILCTCQGPFPGLVCGAVCHKLWSRSSLPESFLKSVSQYGVLSTGLEAIRLPVDASLVRSTFLVSTRIFK